MKRLFVLSFFLVLQIVFIFSIAEFCCFAQETERHAKHGGDVYFSDPEILFPSEKIKMAPALSKFFLQDKAFIGSHSDLNEIVFHFNDGRKKFLSPVPCEIEDFTIKEKLIYLLAYTEKGPEIIICNFHGEVLKRFGLAAVPPSMTTIAVDSRGIIYHNNPSLREGIITAYHSDGKVERVFGNPLPSRYFAEMKLLNRVLICADNSDNLIIAFRFNPIVRKYNQKGELIFEREILTKEVLQRMKAEKLRYPERFTLTEEKRVKISTFTYFTSLTVDEDNKIYLKFGPESLIFQLSESGDLKKKYILAYGQDSIEDFDFWESSMVIDGPFFYFPLAIEGSESFGYILKYKIH